MNGRVIESTIPQSPNLDLADARRVPGQLFGEDTQGAILSRQLGLSPIVGDRAHKAIGLCGSETVFVSDLGTEVVGVRPYSVDAVVGSGDDDGYHLPPAFAQ